MKIILALLTLSFAMNVHATTVNDLIKRYGKPAVMTAISDRVHNKFTTYKSPRLIYAPNINYVTVETLTTDIERAGMTPKTVEAALLEKIEQAKEAERLKAVDEAKRLREQEEERLKTAEQAVEQVVEQARQRYVQEAAERIEQARLRDVQEAERIEQARQLREQELATLSAPEQDKISIFDEFKGLNFVLFVGGLYFLPSIVASARKHHNEGAIILLNLLLGWTFIGWVLALVWAATSVPSKA